MYYADSFKNVSMPSFDFEIDIKQHLGMTMNSSSSNTSWGSYFYNYSLLAHKSNEESDYNKQFKEIAESNGFEFESHSVVTKDGYILELYRVRAPFTPDTGAPVVFLQHGIMSSADCWIANYAHNSPAFVLALDGYDVWLGNSRGTTHSRSHKWLDPEKDSAFWDFSFVELGKYDLPSMISKVIETTKVEKVTYMAHSQGTTLMFYALATNEEWLDERVNLFIALAPVINLEHAHDSFLGSVSQKESLVEKTLSGLKLYEIFGKKWKNNKSNVCKVIPFLCHTGSYLFVNS
jgi:hypothetical protein